MVFQNVLGALVFVCTVSWPVDQVCASEVPYYPRSDAMEQYFNDFPWTYYQKYNVPGLGDFLLDDARDAVKTTLKTGEVWERYILDVLSKYVKPGDSVIDVGAHCGSISLFMSNLVGSTGNVFAFEAERQFLRELYMNLKINNISNVTLFNYWVGNEDKPVIVCPYGLDYSPVCGANPEPQNIEMRKIDSMGFKKISLMKIDVECTEDAVLDGAYLTILRDHPVIIIEIMGGFDGYERVVPEMKKRIENTLAKLTSFGYRVSRIWTDDYLAVYLK